MTRTVAVIVNPLAGRGKGGKTAPEIGAALHHNGIDAALLLAGSPEEALEMARKAVDDGVDAVVAAGGDGTVNLAVQAVAGTDTPLAIIPVGTGNDNANLIGITDVDTAIQALADFHVRPIDVGQVTTSDGSQRWFMGVLSSGFDSCVNERANKMRWPKGELRYLIGILAELGTFKAIPYEVDIDGEKYRDHGMLVAVGNGVSYGGGMKVCAGAKPDDGLFMITWLKKASKFDFLRVFPSVYKGTHVEHHTVEQYTGQVVRIAAPDQIVYADGERIGPLPADISLFRDKLKVVLPANSTIGA
ncbi:MAG: YegS/Rv2252/BmrU family lipid kinase [Actinomycetia bacterium]|nr:YegS/Rv2252/BmrU family lipid kinase [Actinomycetes bacterium]